jgi:uncharacterized membrane protein
LFVTAFSGVGSAAGTSGSIVGSVERSGFRGGDATPIDNATVTLSNGMSTITNSSGGFEFSNVSEGNYTLTVIDNGRTVLTKDIMVTAGQTLDLGKLSVGGGIFGLLFVVLIPLIIIAVVVVIVIYWLRKRKKRKENELLNRQRQEQQETDIHR